MNGSYDPYPDFSPLYEPTSFSWWLFSCLMRWNANIPTRRQIGFGNIFSLLAVFQLIRAVVLSAGITLTKNYCSGR